VVLVLIRCLELQELFCLSPVGASRRATLPDGLSAQRDEMGEGGLGRPRHFSRSTSTPRRRDRLREWLDTPHPGQDVLEEIDHHPTAYATSSGSATLATPVPKRLHGDPEELPCEVLAQHRWKIRHGSTFVGGPSLDPRFHERVHQSARRPQGRVGPCWIIQ
jgi:hypothetical protein